MPPRLTDAQRADIARMLRNGSAFYITADECGVTEQTVGRLAKAWGISPPSRWSPRTLRAVELVRQGMSYKAAARTVQMDCWHLQRACKYHGVRSPFAPTYRRAA